MSGFMKKGAFPTTPVQEELYKAANKVFSLELQLMDAKRAAKKLQPPPPDVAVNHRKFMGHALRVTVDCLDDGLITFIPAGTVGYYEASEYQDVSPGRVGFRGKVADENHWKGFPRGKNHVSTTGFSPSCDCTAGTTRGIVLDPFMGAGTTALVARRLGRDFVGCDLNPEYVEMAQKRIDQEDPTKPTIFENGDKQLSLFAGEVT